MWKDVDGVLTCDPNIYPRAQPMPYLTFDEAAELAYFGAQVGPRYISSSLYWGIMHLLSFSVFIAVHSTRRLCC